MNSELINRLRNPPFGTETSERNIMTSAADALTAAQEENERLREHLRRMLLAQDGVPLNVITFGRWVKEARTALDGLPR